MKRASVVSVFALGVWLSTSVAGAQQPPTAAAPKPPPAPAAKPDESPSLGDPNKTPMEPQRPDTAGDTTGTNGPGTAESAPQLPTAPATPPPSSASQAGALTPLPMWPEPGRDAADLKRQGAEQKRATAAGKSESDVYAEDWWSHARPILELHGNFRVRAELFYHFSLGRIDPPNTALWPRSPNEAYNGPGGSPVGAFQYGSSLCTPDETNQGTNGDAINGVYGCRSGTQAGANMRFRLDPELHVSDNLRVISQIDLFDNLVLGSTPSSYYNAPTVGGGYAVGARSGYEPLGFDSRTTATPTAGINSVSNSIAVKRVWAEYATPVGELRFGRMPYQWGMGMLYNAGDGYDDNYQTTVDRIQFTTGFKPLDLYVSGAWDFVNEGPTSDNIGRTMGGQAYDLSQLDDVDEWVFSVYRKKSRELTKLSLSHGDVVLNGGLQVEYRRQLLADDQNGGTVGCAEGAASLGCAPADLANPSAYTRRAASAWTPDLWVQALYKKFRFELEAVTVQGSIDNANIQHDAFTSQYIGYKIREYGLATELEQKLVEDKLHLGFNFGWASGDADVDGLSPPATGFQNQHGDHTLSTFRFNPSYHVDLILYRNILNRVQGTYYFRPSVKYDFLRDSSGQKLGGGLAAIWSRATQFIQAPGHERDLGIELNAQVYFQSKDGALNDDPEKMGGFFTKLEYGVLFPMAGLGYPSGTANQLANTYGHSVTDLNAAQTLRWYMGVFF
ncbi:MAG TPA: TIGR04551 family protein [Polyangiaceae bacterium]